VTTAALVITLTLAAGAPAVANQGTTGPAPAASGPTSSRDTQRSNRPGGFWDWWNDQKVQKALGLDAAKVRRIDGIYKKRSAELAPTVAKLADERKVLDEMTRALSADEDSYQLQVMKVMGLRSRIDETRVVMLYRIYRELRPDQYKKLQDIFAQHQPPRVSEGSPNSAGK
jgi:Spy/CpxP family protein refolding chaperone